MRRGHATRPVHMDYWLSHPAYVDLSKADKGMALLILTAVDDWGRTSITSRYLSRNVGIDPGAEAAELQEFASRCDLFIVDASMTLQVAGWEALVTRSRRRTREVSAHKPVDTENLLRHAPAWRRRSAGVAQACVPAPRVHGAGVAQAQARIMGAGDAPGRTRVLIPRSGPLPPKGGGGPSLVNTVERSPSLSTPGGVVAAAHGQADGPLRSALGGPAAAPSSSDDDTDPFDDPAKLAEFEAAMAKHGMAS